MSGNTAYNLCLRKKNPVFLKSDSCGFKCCGFKKSVHPRYAVRADHLDWSLVTAASSNRRSWTLASGRPHSALYSAGGTRAPPAHWVCHNWGNRQTWRTWQEQGEWTKYQGKSKLHRMMQKYCAQILHVYLRGLVPLGLLLDQLSFGVHREDPTQRHSNLLIRKHILNRDGDEL